MKNKKKRKETRVSRNTEKTHRMRTRALTRTRSNGVSHSQAQTDDDQKLFQTSRMEEVQALLCMGRFVIADTSAAKSQWLYRSDFLDLNEPDDMKRSGLRLAVCHGNDHRLSTAAPTIKGLFIRERLALCATDNLNLHTRDITKAFWLSKTNLQRHFSCQHQWK